MKRCPYCAEEIQDEAIVCRWCGRNLPDRKNETAKPGAHTFPWARCMLFGIGIAGLIATGRLSQPNWNVNNLVGHAIIDTFIYGSLAALFVWLARYLKTRSTKQLYGIGGIVVLISIMVGLGFLGMQQKQHPSCLNIKAVENYAGLKMKYFLPQDAGYYQIDSNRKFCTEEEAQASGYHR